MARGAYILGPSGLTLGGDEARFFREADPWGFIVFARNLESPGQMRKLAGDLRDAVGWQAPILVDQEGGRVERMGAPYWHSWVPPLDEMARGGARAMALRYQIIGAELRAAGIDVNCAPVADVAREGTHPFLQNRCYGFDADNVTNGAGAVAQGLMAGGCLPVIKHMPGHGLSRVDTHFDLPRVSADRETLEAIDFAPFAALADLPMAMTAHLIFDAIDPDRPATQSPIMVQIMRDQIGFQGLLMTDDITMEALDGTLTERAEASLAAGCDLVLHCNGHMDEMEEIARLPRMTPQAQARAKAALALRPDPLDIDISALHAEFQALVRDGAHG